MECWMRFRIKKEMVRLEVSVKNAWHGRVKYLQPCHSYLSRCGLPLNKSNNHTVVDEKTQTKEQSWSGLVSVRLQVGLACEFCLWILYPVRTGHCGAWPWYTAQGSVLRHDPLEKHSISISDQDVKPLSLVLISLCHQQTFDKVSALTDHLTSWKPNAFLTASSHWDH